MDGWISPILQGLTQLSLPKERHPKKISSSYSSSTEFMPLRDVIQSKLWPGAQF
jgi:hypothetical protein